MTNYHNGANGWTLCKATQKCRLGGGHATKNVADTLTAIEIHTQIGDEPDIGALHKKLTSEFDKSIALTNMLHRSYQNFLNADKAKDEARLVSQDTPDGEQKYVEAEEKHKLAIKEYAQLVNSLNPDDVALNGDDFMENKIIAKGEHFMTVAEKIAGQTFDEANDGRASLKQRKSIAQIFNTREANLQVTNNEIGLFKASPDLLNTFKKETIIGHTALDTYNNAVLAFMTEEKKAKDSRHPIREKDRNETIQFLRQQLQRTAFEEYQQQLSDLKKGKNLGFLNKIQAISLHKQKSKVLKNFFTDLNNSRWFTKVGPSN